MESLHYGLRMPIEQKMQKIGKTFFIQEKSIFAALRTHIGSSDTANATGQCLLAVLIVQL